ncbi:hypothetical protein, partial [Sulfoacidibacillus ferrooxidans]|uniref:hypothetical protein n=1 Tax=Sulfoacidibacillus ferrooxidans TaxID=2005001 RepID=UPI003AFB0E8A
MKKSRKSFALNSIAVLSVAGIFGGLGGASAFAATPTTTPVNQVVTQGQGAHHFGPQGGQQMTEIASILKISPSTLRADLKAKESIADIAQKQGVSTATLTSDLEANFQAQLNKAVSSGKMTAAQEQKMITQFDAHVGDMINSTGFMGGGHHFGPQGGQQMTEIASILKISPSTLRADLKAKESIADIAQKQ